ncbi:MAG: hypothetical protein SPD81_05735 [Candidatus Faecousia sp.]|nr:hypothetical protein [Candidatus Faecousia sp.]
MNPRLHTFQQQNPDKNANGHCQYYSSVQNGDHLGRGTSRCGITAETGFAGNGLSSHGYVPPFQNLGVLYLTERHLSTQKTPQNTVRIPYFFVCNAQNAVPPEKNRFPAAKYWKNSVSR